MKIFEARNELIVAALLAATDTIQEETGDPHADATAELHDDMLTEKVTQFMRVLVEEGKIELDGYLPLEVENSIRNQIIGYLRGKMAKLRDEIPNIGDLDERSSAGREVAAFDSVIASLEHDE